MRDAISAARRLNFACVVILAGGTLAWHGLGLWPGGSPWASWLLGLPLAVVAGMHAARRPSAPFWAAVVALVTFCHGVMEAWASEPARYPAIVESVLSVAIVFSASWDGLLARSRRRRAPPTV